MLCFVLSGSLFGDLVQIAENGSWGCRRSFGYGVYNPEAQKTVVCWNGPGMSVFVREFDHRQSEWSDPQEVKTLQFTGKWDYHNYPCIALAPGGHYVIFYARHTRAIEMLTSPKPHQIQGEWTHTTVVEDKAAYPMPVVTAA